VDLPYKNRWRWICGPVQVASSCPGISSARVDHSDTFSPVARYDSLRLLLAIVAVMNFELRQFDVSTTFLSDDIDEMIYMKQPEGYIDRGHSKYVRRLQRAIYGLKQGSVQFNKKTRGTPEDISLIPPYSVIDVYSPVEWEAILCIWRCTSMTSSWRHRQNDR